MLPRLNLHLMDANEAKNRTQRSPKRVMCKLEALADSRMNRKAHVLADALSRAGLRVEHVSEVMSGNIGLLDARSSSRIHAQETQSLDCPTASASWRGNFLQLSDSDEENTQDLFIKGQSKFESEISYAKRIKQNERVLISKKFMAAK